MAAPVLGKLGEHAGRWKSSLFESLFSDSLAAMVGAKAIGSLHEFGRYLNDLEYRAARTTGAACSAGTADAGDAKGSR